VIELDADTNISSIDFTADPGLTDGHAVVINDAGEYNLVGWMFTGFGADESDTACIFNDSGGEVTINISGGGSVPTVRNGTGSSTTIVAESYSMTVDNVIAGSDVVISTNADPDGSGSNVLQTFDSISGTSVVFNYTNAGATIKIGVFKPGYRPRVFSYTLPANPSTVSGLQTPDPNYA
jgi:hypothetical protein